LGIIISNQCEYCVEQQLKATVNTGAIKEEIIELLEVVLLRSTCSSFMRDVIGGMIKDL